MQLRQLSLALAVALTAGQAAAVTPTQIATARSTGTLHEFYITGASAPSRSVYLAFRTLCNAGSIHTYTSDSAGTNYGSAGNFLGAACTSNGTLANAPAGQTLAMYHTIDGGSFSAVEPHYAGLSALKKRLKALDSASCVAHAGDTVTGDAGYNKCTTVTGNPAAPVDAAPQTPDGGFLDVEPALWSDLFPAGTNSDTYGTTASAGIGQLFGIAVSTDLYRAMQASQGITSAACTDGVGNDDWRNPACMPNISKAQYTSVASQTGGYHSDWQFLAGAAGAGQEVKLCRRVVTSGTQASSNAFFMDSPCNRAAATGGELFPASAADSGSPFIVVENSGTSDVKKCIDAANTSATQMAIGVVSLENDPLAETQTDRNDYRFVKLDGVSPENWGGLTGDDGLARQNALDGSYGFAMELTYFVAGSGSVLGAASDLGAEALGALSTSFGNPDVTNLRGIYITPLVGDPISYPTQVSKGSRFGNNCSPMQLFF
ncbi:MAG: hypothetical protein AB1899_14945 [Pseudomonadota bacterium]